MNTAHPTRPYKATIHYDPRGRETQTIHPDGTFTRIVYGPLTEAHYDEEDNKPGSPHYDSPKTLTYDGLERLVGTEEINVVDGQMERYVTRYAYDRLNSLIRIVDPRGNVKSMIYDALKRKLAMDDPDRGQMTYRYDDGGNLLLSRDAKGQEI
ncbi:hypothetical protein KFU94_50820, partial [Chloroflexi bacterium TSY]|nr:hypothetical protein [Chloroflexi bacterium TSY]